MFNYRPLHRSASKPTGRQYDEWKKQRLDDLEVVYIWADGPDVKAGLGNTRAALLVMIGTLTNGQILLAVESSVREPKES